MVASLAPKNISMCSLTGKKTAMSNNEKTQSIKKQFAKMIFAFFKLPSPIRMLINVPPPIPIKDDTEPIIVMTEPHTPTPASARSPTSAMFPMYMRSTTLYKTFTNCASILGSAIRSTSLPIGSFPRSFSCRIFDH